jgi:hypothetical protein
LAAADGVSLTTVDEGPLLALRDACEILTDLEPRAAVFERRTREKDPDKQIYGRPQMAAKVLFFCNDFAEARAHAEELEDRETHGYYLYPQTDTYTTKS